ncbi:lysin A, L-Ala-D-Glu peptidase domain [Gordonia phage Yakult]|nr:lysin A, L-Ala-D-Glu peptidase domain [Gordonia phage Yakult]
MTFRRVYDNDWSENDWRMCNRDECVVLGLPWADTAPVRRGDVAAVFSAFYHEYAERVPGGITSPIWGWSATNDVGTSNHLSGTAWDVNAPQYGWGGNTMRDRFPARYAACRAIVNDFGGILFWGADWDRKDEMHFQLNAGTADGVGSSQRLRDFVATRIRDGRLIKGPLPPAYSPATVAAFDQLGRFGYMS